MRSQFLALFIVLGTCVTFLPSSTNALSICDEQSLRTPGNVCFFPSDAGVSIPETKSCSGKKMELAKKAESYVGNPYVWGNEGQIIDGEQSFDCSGLVQYLYATVFNVRRSRMATDQQREGKSIARSQLEPGDTIYTKKIGGTRWTHTGIYVGKGMVVDARGRKYGVVKRPLESFEGSRDVSYKRLMEC